MKDVIVYLWVDVWEMSHSLDPEFWEHQPGSAPLHVSLQNPTENDEFDTEDMFSESRNFILLKRKIYLLPYSLSCQNDGIYCEDERCDLTWDPDILTVCAICSDEKFPLVPAD